MEDKESCTNRRSSETSTEEEMRVVEDGWLAEVAEVDRLMIHGE